MKKIYKLTNKTTGRYHFYRNVKAILELNPICTHTGSLYNAFSLGNGVFENDKYKVEKLDVKDAVIDGMEIKFVDSLFVVD